MKVTLSTEQLASLRKIQKTERFRRRRYVKATVLLMLHRGLSYEDIEAILGIDENTVRRYYKGFLTQPLDVYLSNNYVPYTGKLTKDQEEALRAHLRQTLYLDVKPVIAYIKEQFGIDYSVSGCRDLLNRLGFVYKYCKAVPQKANDAKQCEFLEETLPGMLEQVEQGTAEVYFADGCHPTHNTKTGKGWIEKGKEFEIDCNSGRKRININGAIRATKPEHIVYDLADTINAQSTQRLCRQLLKKHPGKTIYYVCDNAPYNRCKWLQEWAKDQRIEFVFLPSYSPNLNLIERLWRLLRKVSINSVYYPTFEEFKEGIISFLENAKDYKAEIRKLLTLNFRTVGQNSYHFAQTTS